jgi:ferredoxin
MTRLVDGSMLGKRFEKDYTIEELERTYRAITSAVTVPVNVAIRAEHRVLDLGRMEELLRGSKRIVLDNCGCRAEMRNCDAPLDVCLTLDDAWNAEQTSGRPHAREVTIEEALDALRRSNEAGLVHMAYTMEGDDRPKIICSCCPCCCHTLSGLLRFGIAKHVLASDLASVTDPDDCTDCGICAERCHFGARVMVGGSLAFRPERCFGCGLCVSKCPTSAIKLVKKSKVAAKQWN